LVKIYLTIPQIRATVKLRDRLADYFGYGAEKPKVWLAVVTGIGDNGVGLLGFLV
jgi:hypothetical protein